MLHVRHALMNKSMSSSATQQREITTFSTFVDNLAFNLKSLILGNSFKGA